MESDEQYLALHSSTTIPEFFRGRSVLITGGTGFVGKVLVENLLRSCPELETIFLLIKPRDGCSTQKRLNEICDLPLFDIVRKENPKAFDKLQIVEGNIQQDNLSLSPNDLEQLVSRVSVVFHVAATVKFNEKLHSAVETNVKGTMRIMELCSKMNISSVVYVSTAYSNSDKQRISEFVYPPPYEPEKLIEAVQYLSDEMDSVIDKIIGKLPNTYAFTKAMAENVVKKYSSKLPVAIVRPSIVSATLREPLPGWIDSINGLTFPMFCGGLGILRSLPCPSATNHIDVIPVDVLSATMIAVAWRTATQTGPKFESVPVYNCTAFPENLLHTGKVVSVWTHYSKKNPMERVMWYPGGGITTLEKHKIWHRICHDVPAKFISLLNKVYGNKLRRHHRIMNLCREGIECYEFFCNRTWEMEVNNFRQLLEELHEEDKGHFFFDMVNIDWQKYLESHYCGMKKFILKEEPFASPQTHRRLRRKIDFVRRIAMYRSRDLTCPMGKRCALVHCAKVVEGVAGGQFNTKLCGLNFEV